MTKQFTKERRQKRMSCALESNHMSLLLHRANFADVLLRG